MSQRKGRKTEYTAKGTTAQAQKEQYRAMNIEGAFAFVSALVTSKAGGYADNKLNRQLEEKRKVFDPAFFLLI